MPPTYIHALSCERVTSEDFHVEFSPLFELGDIESAISRSCSCKGFSKLSILPPRLRDGSTIRPGGVRKILAAPNGTGPRTTRPPVVPGRKAFDREAGGGGSLINVRIVALEFIVDVS